MGSYFSRDDGIIVGDHSIGQDKVRTKSYSSCTSNIKLNQQLQELDYMFIVSS